MRDWSPCSDDVRGHEALWQDGDVVERRGPRTTCAERTICDLSSLLNRRDLLILTDAVLSGSLRRPPLATREHLTQRIDDWSGRRGARLARVNEPVRDASGADLAVSRRRQDVARVEIMQDLGWIVRVMTRDDVLLRPSTAVARVRRALVERGAVP